MEFRPDPQPAAVRVHHHRRAQGGGGQAGEDVIDLGFSGQPALPDRRGQALRGGAQPPQPPLLGQPGIPKLRQAVADLYARRFGVELDPETEAITTIGAKEGFSHLM